MIKVQINGKTFQAQKGETILDVCEKNNIFIPTLCNDPLLEPFGSCFICVVEVEGKNNLVPSCATKVTEGMVIKTETEKVRKARKMAVELLLSNHYADCVPPCSTKCPANVATQAYITLAANGNFKEAIEVIREKNPFPSICGRICPRPCEDECRRNKLDEPVGIDFIKRYIADKVMADKLNIPVTVTRSTGKKIAVIGAGPAGLSAAYYLRLRGHEVDVYESQEKPGGMLRYGIPEYRLPQHILESEIKFILGHGITLYTSQKLGKDFSIKSLKEKYDAIFISIGAWTSRSMRVENENHKDVFKGIDFLYKIAKGYRVKIGKRVVVVGGGNTAIDAARTSLRLGAEEVVIAYRRTQKEMPANEVEIIAACEEGIKFHFLVSPKEIKIENNKVTGLLCQKMKLGEPDESGRRRPIPIEGEQLLIECDNIISAIGQKPEAKIVEKEGLELEWGNIKVKPGTYETSIKGVFAAGDVVTGAATAVEAINGGRRAAFSIDSFIMTDKALPEPEPFYVLKGSLNEIRKEDMEIYKKTPRHHLPELPVDMRKSNFLEVEKTFADEDFKHETDRCIECGCKVFHTCKLRKYAEEFGAEPSKFKGEQNKYLPDLNHPFIIRDSNKCILCGRCVRTCLEIRGIGALGFVNRGFKTIVLPTYGDNLTNTECVGCGQCIESCPVGALAPKNPFRKIGPWKTHVRTSVCALCDTACIMNVNSIGQEVVSINSVFKNEHNSGRLCKKGRFGFEYTNSQQRILKPLLKHKKRFIEITYEEAFEIAREILKGQGSKGFISVGHRLSLEELYLLHEDMATHLMQGARMGSITANDSEALYQVTGAALTTINEETLYNADVIINFASDLFKSSPVTALKLFEAKKKGSYLINISKYKKGLGELANSHYNASSALMTEILLSVLKLVFEKNSGNLTAFETHIQNYKDVIKSIKNYQIKTKKAINIAKSILKSIKNKNKLVIVFEEDLLTDTAIQAILSILILKSDLKNSGIVLIKKGVNSHGRTAFFKGYTPKLDISQFKTGIILFEDPAGTASPSKEIIEQLKSLEKLIVVDNFFTKTAKLATLVIPGPTYFESSGSVLNNLNTVCSFEKAISSPMLPDTLSIITGICATHPTSSSAIKELLSLPPSNANLDTFSYFNIKKPEKIMINFSESHTIAKNKFNFSGDYLYSFVNTLI